MHDGKTRAVLNERQYRALCEACDRVLLAEDTTIERVSIPWLHVVREHPIFLANYRDIFEHKKCANRLGCEWLQALRNMARWVLQLGRALCWGGQFWFGSKELAQKVDVLFVSHLINTSHAGQTDFYFGELPEDMAAQGYSVAVVLINHSARPGVALACKWKESAVPRIILSGTLCFSEEITLHRRLKKESLRLREHAKKVASNLFRKALVRAAQEAMSNGSLTALRMSRQMGALVGRLKPHAIIVTHEGHAWERVVFAATKNAAPEVLRIGYQHAALFRLQHAIRRNLTPEYNPDCILTAGMIGKKQLEQAPRLKGIPISELGSNRSFRADMFDSQSAQRLLVSGYFGKRACLVLPEGIASECHLLFEFSLACARACPDVQFIWRLHPVITFESLVGQNAKLRNMPDNIVFSRENLDTDIARCSWALYRGTTAIIRAAAAGVRPLYVQAQGEMSIDPLYELDTWRIAVAKIDDFKRAVKSDEANFPSEGEAKFALAAQYCRDFFSPLNVDALKSVISQNVKSKIIHNARPHVTCKVSG